LDRERGVLDEQRRRVSRFDDTRGECGQKARRGERTHHPQRVVEPEVGEKQEEEQHQRARAADSDQGPGDDAYDERVGGPFCLHAERET
jgi:hypothetical protein